MFSISFLAASGQDMPGDSVIIPLKIRLALEITGPVIYFTDNDKLSIEGSLSYDLNAKMSLFLGTGYASYKYSQYNYSYLEKGSFFKVGVDFNLLKPEINMGKYYAGVGLHYGLSPYTYETLTFEQQNYWGTTTSSVSARNSLGHFLEISPGFKAEIIRNFSIGWSLSFKKLIYSGTSKDLMPVFIPGYGGGGKPSSVALYYFITFNIPYKKIKVAIKKEKPEEPEETDEDNTISTEIR